MRKSFPVFVVALALAPAAFALPSGLSGLGVGFGGYFGDLDQAYIGGEFDFALPPYVCIGPEIMLGFGDDVTTLLLGAETRIYFIPNYNFIIQPHAAFGGGFAHLFIGDRWHGWPTTGEDQNGGYIHFGGGMDFEIPRAPVTPYFDMGGLLLIRDNTSGEFDLEGGIRVNVW